MFKKILSHSFLYAIGPQIPRLAGLFILPLLTQYLTPKDYGIHGILMAYTGLLSGIKDLGLLVLLVNYYFQRKKFWPLLWRKLYGYLVLWMPIYAIIQAIFIYWALPQSELHNFEVIYILSFINIIIFDIPILMAGRYLQFKQKPLFIAVVSAVTGMVGLMLNYYTIVILRMGYIGWIWATFIASFVMFASYFHLIFIKLKLYPLIKLNFKTLINDLKISTPTVPHNYSSYLLNTSDRFLLSRYNIPVDEIGKYNMAYTFGNYFDFLGTAVGMAVGPIYYKIFDINHRVKNLLAKTFTFLLQTVFILIGFVTALWIKEIMNFLISNNELKSSYIYAGIIIMAFVYRPFYWSNINLLIFHKKTHVLWKITLIGSLINVAINLIFIPLIGIWSAVWATFISMMFIGFAGGYYSEIKKIGRNKYKEIIWLSAVFISTVLVGITVNWIWYLKLIVATIILITGLIMILYYYKKIKKITRHFNIYVI